LENGQIAEHGTFDELMSLRGPFSRLLQEFGSESSRTDEQGELIEDADVTLDTQREKALLSLISEKDVGKAAGSGKLEVRAVSVLADVCRAD
jgi:ATP-binding cassette subfamily C (CFTR/MRP) protein 1